LTGQTVVDATGISNATLTFYEQDKSLPRLPLLERVLDFLEGDFDYAWALYLLRAGATRVRVPVPEDDLPVQRTLIRGKGNALSV
jgi:transcriptional regulator with XRE-family HTH domain